MTTTDTPSVPARHAADVSVHGISIDLLQGLRGQQVSKCSKEGIPPSLKLQTLSSPGDSSSSSSSSSLALLSLLSLTTRRRFLRCPAAPPLAADFALAFAGCGLGVRGRDCCCLRRALEASRPANRAAFSRMGVVSNTSSSCPYRPKASCEIKIYQTTHSAYNSPPPSLSLSPPPNLVVVLQQPAQLTLAGERALAGLEDRLRHLLVLRCPILLLVVVVVVRLCGSLAGLLFLRSTVVRKRVYGVGDDRVKTRTRARTTRPKQTQSAP